jgi:hypothetical protein
VARDFGNSMFATESPTLDRSPKTHKAHHIHTACNVRIADKRNQTLVFNIRHWFMQPPVESSPCHTQYRGHRSNSEFVPVLVDEAVLLLGLSKPNISLLASSVFADLHALGKTGNLVSPHREYRRLVMCPW